jgi:hypothetical protein
MPDLTTSEGVRDLMLSSKDAAEWDANCDAVKAANGGDYPRFWFATVLASGLHGRVAASWGDPTALDLKINTIG